VLTPEFVCNLPGVPLWRIHGLSLGQTHAKYISVEGCSFTWHTMTCPSVEQMENVFVKFCAKHNVTLGVPKYSDITKHMYTTKECAYIVDPAQWIDHSHKNPVKTIILGTQENLSYGHTDAYCKIKPGYQTINDLDGLSIFLKAHLENPDNRNQRAEMLAREEAEETARRHVEEQRTKNRNRIRDFMSSQFNKCAEVWAFEVDAAVKRDEHDFKGLHDLFPNKYEIIRMAMTALDTKLRDTLTNPLLQK
jgi:hypothetical protein